MSLAHGGHLTHGLPVNFSGRGYTFFHYGVERETGLIDIDEVRAQALEHQPKLIVAGASAYPAHHRLRRLPGHRRRGGRRAHGRHGPHRRAWWPAGRILRPFPHCEWVTTTTHKTLAGPRGGTCLLPRRGRGPAGQGRVPRPAGRPARARHRRQGRVLPAGRAPRSSKPSSGAPWRTPRTLAETLLEGGLKLVSGGTDNHLMLVDFSGTEMTGKRAQELLDRVGITANKNAVPYDERPPTVTSGLRLGTPAMTTRGFGPEEMREVGRDHRRGPHRRPRPKPTSTGCCARSRALTAAFPLYRVAGRLMAERRARAVAGASARPSWEELLHGDRPGGRHPVELPAPAGGGRAGQEPADPRHRVQRRPARSALTARSAGACGTNWASPPASGTSCAAACTPSRTPSSRRRTTGWPSAGREIYCTHQPCVVCAKMLVNAGIVAVYFCGRLPRRAGHGGVRRGGNAPGPHGVRSSSAPSEVENRIVRYHFGI